MSKARFHYFDWNTQQKSLQDIIDLCRVDRREKQAELRAEMKETTDEQKSALERAGLTFGGLFADDSDKWNDEAYYRCRVRVMVFEVPDRELRREVMSKIGAHRHALYNYWEMLSGFDEQLLGKLRSQRCRPPELHPRALLAAPFVLVVVAYSFLGKLDALLAGVILVIPALVFLIVDYIGRLYQHEVTLREAIRCVDQWTCQSKREAQRRLYLPKIFSTREERTGEADREDEPFVGTR